MGRRWLERERECKRRKRRRPTPLRPRGEGRGCRQPRCQYAAGHPTFRCRKVTLASTGTQIVRRRAFSISDLRPIEYKSVFREPLTPPKNVPSQNLPFETKPSQNVSSQQNVPSQQVARQSKGQCYSKVYSTLTAFDPMIPKPFQSKRHSFFLAASLVE